jgi:alkaline phosphatase D
MRLGANDSEQIYRSFRYSPSLEIFMLDMRTYRGPNTPNRQTVASEKTDFLGNKQLQWLKQKLRSSRATWKVIGSDMPVGLIVRDGKTDFETLANGDGPALGRELEMADLLRFIKQNNIRNVVWLTADVHYAAAHYYDPNKAVFSDFLPFWEFVAGPIHAGTYGPAELDNTFGPQLKFVSIPPDSKQNLPPIEGKQFFGTVKIEGSTEVMTVDLRNLEGNIIYTINLQPET